MFVYVSVAFVSRVFTILLGFFFINPNRFGERESAANRFFCLFKGSSVFTHTLLNKMIIVVSE